MARKSSTVHLEESTWNEIEKYQKENGGITRNEAIERMFTERRLLIKLSGVSKEDSKKIDNKSKIEDDKTIDAINSAYEDMPE
ncbi:hypothetical protein QJR26_18065 (plasmid) [Clostridium baratii]